MSRRFTCPQVDRVIEPTSDVDAFGLGRRRSLAMSTAKSRAFTLLELLVVISIIAILISVLLPSLSAAREQSRGVICRTQMRELSAAAVSYTVDYGKFPPCIDNYTASGWDSNKWGLDWLGIGDQNGAFQLGNPLLPDTGNPKGFAAAPRFGLLWPYYQNQKAILCPSDIAGPFTPNQMIAPGNGKFSYTMVSVMGIRSPEKINAITEFTSEQINPSSAPVFVEEHPDGMNNMHREGNSGAGINPSPDGGDKLISRHGPKTARWGIAPGSGTPAKLLQGTSNIGFADGHVDGIRTSFGFGKTHLTTYRDSIPNNITGLLYYYGVKFELLRFTEPEP